MTQLLLAAALTAAVETLFLARRIQAPRCLPGPVRRRKRRLEPHAEPRPRIPAARRAHLAGLSPGAGRGRGGILRLRPRLRAVSEALPPDPRGKCPKLQPRPSDLWPRLERKNPEKRLLLPHPRRAACCVPPPCYGSGTGEAVYVNRWALASGFTYENAFSYNGSGSRNETFVVENTPGASRSTPSSGLRHNLRRLTTRQM